MFVRWLEAIDKNATLIQWHLCMSECLRFLAELTHSRGWEGVAQVLGAQGSVGGKGTGRRQPLHWRTFSLDHSHFTAILKSSPCCFANVDMCASGGMGGVVRFIPIRLCLTPVLYRGQNTA